MVVGPVRRDTPDGNFDRVERIGECGGVVPAARCEFGHHNEPLGIHSDVQLSANPGVSSMPCACARSLQLRRHPGQGWLDGDDWPGPLIRWLAEEVAVPSSALAGTGTRDATRSSHRQLAIRHLGLRPFVPDDMGTAIDLAARAAFHTDEGRIILIGLIHDMKALRFVLSSTAALERIGLAGRARVRRISAQALNDALDRTRKGALTDRACERNGLVT